MGDNLGEHFLPEQWWYEIQHGTHQKRSRHEIPVGEARIVLAAHLHEERNGLIWRGCCRKLDDKFRIDDPWAAIYSEGARVFMLKRCLDVRQHCIGLRLGFVGGIDRVDVHGRADSKSVTGSLAGAVSMG